MSEDGGAFSAYLIGTYEKRLNIFTVLHIINPTTEELRVVIAFYDDKEEYQTCLKRVLTPNDLEEINVREDVKELGPKFGVVKIISYKDDKPVHGIVGFQRHAVVVPGTALGFTESVLASVPTELAEKELEIILEKCP